MLRNTVGSQELEDETSIDVRPLKERAKLLLMDWEDIDRALLGRTAREFSEAELRKMHDKQALFRARNLFFFS